MLALDEHALNFYNFAFEARDHDLLKDLNSISLTANII